MHFASLSELRIPLLLPVALFVAFYAQNPDHWRHQQFLGLAALTLYACSRLKPLVVSIPLAASLLSALFVFQRPGTPFGPMVHVFDSASARAFAVLAMIAWTVPRLNLLSTFHWLALANSAMVCANWAVGRPALGALDNPALDGMFIAMCYPLIAVKPDHTVMDFKGTLYCLAALVLPILACVATGASTPLFLLGLGIAVSFGTLPLAAIVGALTLGAGIFLQGRTTLFDSNGRVEIWRLSMEWWAREAPHWFGTGLGTYEAFGPMLRTNAIWLHNDWLQILFEQGFVGLFLVTVLASAMLTRAWKRRWLLASVVVYFAAGFTQMPLRHFITAVFGAVLVKECFHDTQKT